MPGVPQPNDLSLHFCRLFTENQPRAHTVLPFVVEHAGRINKEGMQFFRMCRDAADNKLNARASGLSSWSSKRFSNCFLQSLSF